MKMPIKTRKAMEKYAQELPASSARAQCYTIAGYDLIPGEKIAERFVRDHGSRNDVHRHAYLMVEAGCATQKGDKYSGNPIIFEDGSTF